MLTLLIPGDEVYDEETNTFSTVGDQVLYLEHSLVSLSKWEAKFGKAFLGPEPKTSEELVDYIIQMILNPTFDPKVFDRFSQSMLDTINDYINSAQSATTFSNLPKQTGNAEIITSELIYYWLVAYTIPFDVETWHLNRLFALIRICNVKNSKPKKMSRNEIAQRQRELNAQRRAASGSSG